MLPHSLQAHSSKAPDVPVEPGEVALIGAAPALRLSAQVLIQEPSSLWLPALSCLKSLHLGSRGDGWWRKGGAGGVKTQHLLPVVSITYQI